MRTAGNDFSWTVTEACAQMDSDPGKLRQILLNLLSNANKFTEHGKIRLDVHLDDAGTLVFAVHDTGIGISEEAQSHLFEEFFQGDLSPTKRYGGADLGLALCKRFCEMMGGSIGVESTTGVGSVFTVRLPRSAPVTPS